MVVLASLTLSEAALERTAVQQREVWVEYEQVQKTYLIQADVVLALDSWESGRYQLTCALLDWKVRTLQANVV